MTVHLSRCTLSFPDVRSAFKGVIWLLIATAAEVPPVVSLALSLCLPFIHRLLAIGIFIFGSERYVFPIPHDDCLINLISTRTTILDPLNVVRS